MNKALVISGTLLLAVSCLPSASPFEPAPKEIVVAGRIVNRNGSESQVVKVNFFNPFDPEGDSRAQRIDPETGTFAVRYPLPYATDMTIDYEGFIYLYGEPGDSLYVEIDAAKIGAGDPSEAVRFSGDRAEINAFYPACMKYMAGLVNSLAFEESDSLPVATYAERLTQSVRSLKDSLAAYGARNRVLDECLRLVEREAADWISATAVSGYREADRSPEALAAKRELYRLPVFDTWNPENFRSQMFPYHLQAYAGSVVLADPVVQREMQNGSPVRAMREALKLLEREPTGFCRDFLAFCLVRAFGEEVPPDSLPEPSALVSSPYVREQIEKRMRNEKPRPDPPVLANVVRLTTDGKTEFVPEGDLLRLLADRHPGKAIYVDVYASWCHFCREEFPAARRLHERLQGENVAFVNLCLKSSESRWREIVDKYELAGENYFLNDDDSKLFMTACRVSGFPTYLLIGRDGEVADTDAPRPSDDGTEARIRTLL